MNSRRNKPTVDECVQYSTLRSALRSDLQSEYGFSAPEAGEILNWFDPSSPEYLEHVDSWQKLLCAGASPCETKFAKKNAFGNYDLFDRPAYQIGAIHQVAKLVYKWHGNPRRETDMEEVKTRLSQPLPITLDNSDIQGIRQSLKGIRPVDLNALKGRFGPGATFEGFTSLQKWSRLGAIPDVPPNLYRANPRDPWIPCHFDDEGITKIAEVPKSIKCNRIVSSEPAMRMFAQLAVADALTRQMHGVFYGHVSLHDQERHNQFLFKPQAATIDLSDASDHISVELVQAVLPQLWPVLAKVRSQLSQFPDGEIIRLGTFAPMGSGVCFPILTLVGLGVCKYATDYLPTHLRKQAWYTVYGDDIIVPIFMYDIVTQLLQGLGLVVNHAKSCCTGIYRESCGREMYLTRDITPVYLRDPVETVDASKIEQVCSTLSARSFNHTAETIATLSGAIRGYRFNKRLQRMEVCVRATSARQKLVALDDYDGLNRWFCTRSQMRLRGDNTPQDRQGVNLEVWTAPSWRYKPGWDYPYLHEWLVRHSP